MLVVWTAGERGCLSHAVSVGELLRERGMPIMERHAVSGGGGGTTTHFDIKRKQSEEAGGWARRKKNSVCAPLACYVFPFLQFIHCARFSFWPPVVTVPSW
jgi:hypothetical protein